MCKFLGPATPDAGRSHRCAVHRITEHVTVTMQISPQVGVSDVRGRFRRVTNPHSNSEPNEAAFFVLHTSCISRGVRQCSGSTSLLELAPFTQSAFIHPVLLPCPPGCRTLEGSPVSSYILSPLRPSFELVAAPAA